MEAKIMAFVEIEPEAETEGYTKYPKFEKVGDNIEGNLYEFDTDGYGNKRMVLEVGEDDDENQYPVRKYKVQVDEDKKVIYEEDDEEYYEE